MASPTSLIKTAEIVLFTFTNHSIRRVMSPSVICIVCYLLALSQVSVTRGKVLNSKKNNDQQTPIEDIFGWLCSELVQLFIHLLYYFLCSFWGVEADLFRPYLFDELHYKANTIASVGSSG